MRKTCSWWDCDLRVRLLKMKRLRIISPLSPLRLKSGLKYNYPIPTVHLNIVLTVQIPHSKVHLVYCLDSLTPFKWYIYPIPTLPNYGSGPKIIVASARI